MSTAFQDDLGLAMYCPVWVYLWKTASVGLCPMLKQNSHITWKEIGTGTQLLRVAPLAELLAFFDCCIMMVTAH